MGSQPGFHPPELTALVRAQDRLSFLYLEHCVVSRDSNAVTATDERGTVHIPAASIGALFLGPGTTVSQQAMLLLAESGATAVWVGEQGIRYYCHGRSLARSSRLLEAQARLVSSRKTRLSVAREMYAMRFPGEDTSGKTMQQLRGKEGTRVARAYAKEAQRTGVAWSGRSYKVDDFDDADVINQALSAINTSLYGVVHSVIVSLGCAPGLGFVHNGNARSFVFDIADLYKTAITIPLAFDLASGEHPDIGYAARRAMREMIRGNDFLGTCVSDIRHLLSPGLDEPLEDDADVNSPLSLWDGMGGLVDAGRNYGDSPPDERWA